MLLTQVLEEELPSHPVAVLSGPGFAADIAKGLPTAMAVAASDAALAEHLAQTISGQTFRLYASTDRIGVQLGGALKNVLAIAAGIVEGAGLGESARAALIARGLAEMSRLVVAVGGQADTVRGLSGLGDLVLTATSHQSRNLRFGISLGQGMHPRPFMAGWWRAPMQPPWPALAAEHRSICRDRCGCGDHRRAAGHSHRHATIDDTAHHH